MSKSKYYLQNINVYPIKSLGGISYQSIMPEKRGLPHDRRWVLIDENNNFLTQRKFPEMALISVRVLNGSIELQHKVQQIAPLVMNLKNLATEVQAITVWDDNLPAPVIQEKAISDWFQKALGSNLRLAHMDEETRRLTDPEYAPGEEVSFADSFPFMVTNQASLDDLNAKLPEPILMNRFRPNLVISGGAPFEEDQWNELEIGEAEFKVVKPCARCLVITIDQETAEKNQEPLKTLSTFRKTGNKIIFGQNLILKKAGLMKVGDEVFIKSY